ncbi:TPA: hypothetical protein DCW54_01555 [Candidatus Dependentiae bacterium]|nr:hypothetical protein [Candidatus Dependentiae bacterium]
MIGVLFLAGTVFSPSYTWWKKSEQYQTDNSDEKNKNINNISINTTVNSTASAQIVDTVVSAVKEEVEHIKEQVSASFEMLTLIAKELIWEYKWRLGLMGSASGYGFLVFKNQQLKTYLTHPYRWHYWASMNLNPRILRLRSTNDLVWNLIREIQSRYTSAQCPDDFILPFMRFIEEIEHEINALKTYIRFGNTFEYLNISNYVFFDQNLHKQCNGWLEQAETVKAMFLHWIADYKLQQHARRLRFQLLLKGW